MPYISYPKGKYPKNYGKTSIFIKILLWMPIGMLVLFMILIIAIEINN